MIFIRHYLQCKTRTIQEFAAVLFTSALTSRDKENRSGRVENPLCTSAKCWTIYRWIYGFWSSSHFYGFVFIKTLCSTSPPSSVVYSFSQPLSDHIVGTILSLSSFMRFQFNLVAHKWSVRRDNLLLMNRCMSCWDEVHERNFNSLS